MSVLLSLTILFYINIHFTVACDMTQCTQCLVCAPVCLHLPHIYPSL